MNLAKNLYNKIDIDNFFIENNKALIGYVFMIVHDEGISIDMVSWAYIVCIDNLSNINHVTNLEPYIKGMLKYGCFKNFKHNQKEIRIEDEGFDFLRGSYNCSSTKRSKKEEEIDDKVKNAIAEYGSVNLAIIGIRKERRILKSKEKFGTFNNKINNRSHVKVLYKNEIIWLNIISKTNNKIIGYIKTMGKFYQKKISISENNIIGIN